MKQFAYILSALFLVLIMYAEFVHAGINDFYDLNDNQLPSGWILDKRNNGTNYSFQNGKFYVSPTDTAYDLIKALSITDSIEKITLEWDANKTQTQWGMSSGAGIIMNDGIIYRAYNGVSDINPTNLAYDPNSYVNIRNQNTQFYYNRDYAADYDDFHYSLSFDGASIKFSARRISDPDFLWFDISITESIDLNHVNSILFIANTTTNNSQWIDNLRIEVITVPSEKVTFEYDQLNRLTSATYGQNRINYVYDSASNILQVNTPTGCENQYYRDADGDGFGDPAISQKACSQPTGFVIDNTDCNDDPTTGIYEHPGNTWYPDVDGDGYYSGVVNTTSCTRLASHYAEEELASISEQDNCPGTANSDQADYDGDGIGDICDSFFTNNQYSQDTDQDGIADEWEMDKFGNLIIADAITDTDQDGITDLEEFKIDFDPTFSFHTGYVTQEKYDQDMLDLTEYNSYLFKCDYDLDGDVDGFDLMWFSGEFGQTEIDIDNDNDTFSEIQGDCDDTDSTIHPDANEDCDGIDNNCNGVIDEGCL